MPGSRAPGTLAARLSVWQRFLLVDPAASVEGLHRFAEAELARGVAPATVLRYLSHVTVARQRVVGPLTPREQVVMNDVRDVVRRRVWERPVQQAVPMVAQHAQALFDRDPLGLGLLAVVMFVSGLRHADAVRLRGSDVRFQLDHVELTLRAEKTNTVGRPARCVAVCLPPQPRLRLAALAVRSRNAPMWQQPYHRFMAFLKQLDPSLTAHSPRRGFVQAALAAGVDDAAVMRSTGHHTIEGFAAYAGVLPGTWRQQMLTASLAVARQMPL